MNKQETEKVQIKVLNLNPIPLKTIPYFLILNSNLTQPTTLLQINKALKIIILTFYRYKKWGQKMYIETEIYQYLQIMIFKLLVITKNTKQMNIQIVNSSYQINLIYIKHKLRERYIKIKMIISNEEPKKYRNLLINNKYYISCTYFFLF